jgi:hypothetical protein
MLTTVDPKTKTLVDRLRRVAYRQGFKMVKLHREGFILHDVRDAEKVVLGTERGTGATIAEVAKFLKLAA